MTEETDDQVYEAHRSSFLEESGELGNLQAELAACQQRRDNHAADDVENQVQLAMKLFAQIERVAEDPAARAEIRPLLASLGLWIGLEFENGIKGKKREIRILRGGIMTLGSEDPPVPLFGPLNRDPESQRTDADLTQPVAIENPLEITTAIKAAPSTPVKKHRRSEGRPGSGLHGPLPGRRVDKPGSRQHSSHQKGISFTKVNRGNRTAIELFLAGLMNLQFLAQRLL